MTTFTRIAAAVALTAGLIAAPAFAKPGQQPQAPQQQANEQELARAGQWVALAAMSQSGVPMCIMGTETNPYSFYLKYFRGENQVALHVFNQNWNIQPGAQIAIRVQIDNESWSANATALASRRGLEVTVGGEELSRFVRAISGGSAMVLSFPNANETPWQVRLAGADVTMRAFDGCVGAVNGQTRNAGNGTGGTGSTKPSGGQAQAPRQAPAMQPIELPGRNISG